MAAVLLLHEAAEAAPAVFNVHVKSFIDAVWHPLRDPKLPIRDAAMRALKVRTVHDMQESSRGRWGQREAGELRRGTR